MKRTPRARMSRVTSTCSSIDTGAAATDQWGLGGRRARVDRLVGEEMEPEGHVDRLAVGGDPARDLGSYSSPFRGSAENQRAWTR